MDATIPRILAVCTGNICRSPAIQLLLTARVGGVATIASAGTHAIVGAPVAGPMAALLDDAGAPTNGFAARQITERLIVGADLILTASAGHRSSVVSLAPRAMRRCFTLLEFARAVKSFRPGPERTPADRVRALAAHAALARPRMRLTEADTDIPDPYGEPQEVYDQAFEMILGAVDVIAPVLRVQPPAGEPRRAAGPSTRVGRPMRAWGT